MQISKTHAKPNNHNEAKLFVCKERDWSAWNEGQELTTNRRRGFQKRERESENYKLPENTKKLRPWGS